MSSDEHPNSNSHSTAVTDRRDGQYLGFPLGEERFAIEILRVQEIRALAAITPIPNAPRHILGVINLRGTIVPVIDLRLRFGLRSDANPRTAIILVVTVRSRIVGLIADSVPKVLTVSSEEVAPPPDFGQRVDVSFVSGVLHRSSELVLLLDLERLLADELNDASLQDNPASAA